MAAAAVVHIVISTTVATMLVAVVVEVAASTATMMPMMASISSAAMMMVTPAPFTPTMVLVVALSMREGRKRPISVAHLRTVLTRGARGASACRVRANFVSDLTAELAAAKLAMRLEAVVPVNADQASVQHCPIERVHGQCSLLPR